eukprot:849069-Pyramimonas_sp.AAC.1
MDADQLGHLIGNRFGASDLNENWFLNDRYDLAVANLNDQKSGRNVSEATSTDGRCTIYPMYHN